MNTPTPETELLLSRLDAVRRTSNGWQARCPSHDDGTPSLSVAIGDIGGVVIHCHAGCSVEDVVGAVGLTMADLFPQSEKAFRHKGSSLAERKLPASFNVEDGGKNGEFLSATPDLYGRKERQLRIRPLGAALSKAPAEPDWLWAGYVAPGAITLLAGKPKVGKTTFMFGLFGALVTGTPFLGRGTSKSGLLLLSEEREGTLAEKQRRFELSDGVDLLMRHEASGRAWHEVVAETVAHAHNRGIRVLAVDTWDKWADLDGDTENSAGAVNTALGPLMVAAASGLGVLIVTHQRKSSGSHGEAVRGSNALTGGVDIIVELERVGRDQPDARVLRTESRYSGTPDELVARLGEDGYEACGDLETLREQTVERRIVEALRDGELTTDELADSIDEPRGTVNRYAGQMFGAGRLHRTGKGKRGDPHRWSAPKPTESPTVAQLESKTAGLGLPFDDAEAA